MWLRVREAWCFVEALGDLDPERWLNAAASARQSEVARRDAGECLAGLVRQDSASLLAWCLNDGIDTQAWVCLRGSPQPHASGTTNAIHDAIDAARGAALAVLLRPRLDEQRFRALYEPFESLIPWTNLCGPADRTPRGLYGIFVRDGSGARQRSRAASHSQP